ncbi:AIR carboxylase family protein, partial [Patescibacteria group bacterium]|nr:AIR carboxylase family protein [Patescibacteria group bacterium]
ETGTICGHAVPVPLQDGDELPYIMDTPTTKAIEGHDENLSAAEIRAQYPQQTYTLLQVCQIARHHCRQCGIVLADTKLEMSNVVCDEVLTPDSSRFWLLPDWLESRKSSVRRAPSALDKQLVREWGKRYAINTLDPSNPDHVVQVHSIAVPDNLLRQTAQAYRYIFWRLTGKTLEMYLRNVMGVGADTQLKTIAIVFGSKSDVEKNPEMCNHIASARRTANINVHILSCHRNPEQVRSFAEDVSADAIICLGSKSFALPGVLDAWLYACCRSIPVIGVALGEPGSESLAAAVQSIKELPGQPVVMDEIDTGQPYQRWSGLVRALDRVITGELPPAKPREDVRHIYHCL